MCSDWLISQFPVLLTLFAGSSLRGFLKDHIAIVPVLAMPLPPTSTPPPCELEVPASCRNLKELNCDNGLLSLRRV